VGAQSPRRGDEQHLSGARGRWPGRGRADRFAPGGRPAGAGISPAQGVVASAAHRSGPASVSALAANGRSWALRDSRLRRDRRPDRDRGHPARRRRSLGVQARGIDVAWRRVGGAAEKQRGGDMTRWSSSHHAVGLTTVHDRLLKRPWSRLLPSIVRSKRQATLEKRVKPASSPAAAAGGHRNSPARPSRLPPDPRPGGVRGARRPP
jgi:hypothetical protein